MPTRAQFVAEVESLVGTPWRKHGRKAGPDGGLNCVGIPIVAARAVGLRIDKDPLHGELPTQGELHAGLAAYCDQVQFGERQPGDILCLFEGREVRHVAVLVRPAADGAELLVTMRDRAVLRRLPCISSVGSVWRLRGLD